MRSPRISPDGKHLAYFAAASGKEVLVVMDLTNLAKPPKLILAAEEARERGDRTVGGFRWMGNDHVVITVLSRENLGTGLVDFRRLIAYSLPTGTRPAVMRRMCCGSIMRRATIFSNVTQLVKAPSAGAFRK